MKIQNIIIILLLPFMSMAQSRLSQDAKGIIYDREGVFDMRIHTHGWAVGYQIGKSNLITKPLFIILNWVNCGIIKKRANQPIFQAFLQAMAFGLTHLVSKIMLLY